MSMIKIEFLTNGESNELGPFVKGEIRKNVSEKIAKGLRDSGVLKYVVTKTKVDKKPKNNEEVKDNGGE